MTGWLEVTFVAFTAQLAVLPGEKVQLIIATLSTRFSPYVVVSAAGAAFAGWTAVEIAVGGTLTRLLPGGVLDAFTAGMFLLFAYLLYRSIPESPPTVEETDGSKTVQKTDGGVETHEPEIELPLSGIDLPDRLEVFVPIFVMMAVGEFGDKTQLITITLAANYGATSAIWFGEMFAIIPVSIANALFFHRFSGRFDARKAHIFGAAVFFFFAADTVMSLTVDFSVWETVVEGVGGLVRSFV
jgi:putative Ca2+/H+ antiporter (TMEM165/GDT1 family)